MMIGRSDGAKGVARMVVGNHIDSGANGAGARQMALSERAEMTVPDSSNSVRPVSGIFAITFSI